MSHFGRGLNIRFREHIKRLFTSRRLVGDSNSVTTSKTKAGAFKNLGARPKSSIRKSSSTDTTINSDFVSTRRQECPQSTQLSKRPSTRTRNSEYSLPYSERLGLRSKCDSFSKPSEVGDVKRSQTIGSVDGPMRRLSSSSECLVPSFASQNWSRRSYHSDKTCSYVESSYSDFGPGSRKSTGRARRIDGLNRGFHHRYGSNKQTNSYENVCLPQRSRQKQNLRHPGISENDINRPPLSTVASGQQPLNPRKKKSSGTYEKGQPNYQLQRKEPANVIVAKMTRGGELRKIRASVSQIRYRDNASRSHKQPGDQWNDCTTSIEAPQRTSQMRGSKPGTRFPTKSMRFGYKSCRNGHGTSVEYMQTQNSSRGDLEPNLVQRISAACLTGDGIRGSVVASSSNKLNNASQASSNEITHPAQAEEAKKPGNYSLMDRFVPDDENLCPTGTHEIFTKGKSCVCMQTAQLENLQAQLVLYEWHLGEPEMFDGARVVGEGSVPPLNSYTLMKPTRISTGGQGTVAWVGVPTSNMEYALKFKAREGRNEKNWKIERREAQILKKLKHPFIVTTYHIYETEDSLFMSFEYLSGGCLWNHLARIGTLPECYVTYYAACILTALSYLHERGIVYRDLKAENIVLDYQNRPQLIDFGMAKYLPSVKKHMHVAGECPKVQINETPKGEDILHDWSSEWATSHQHDETEIETDDPPTRYYFAAYLAPEIYSDPASSNQFIDSWGLGYIIVEMILGYGIFLPMPWANTKGQHLSPTWQLQLPPDALIKITAECSGFIYKMLMRVPDQRMSLKTAMQHPLFARVPWPSLPFLTGPNLSKFLSPEDLTNRSHVDVHKADAAHVPHPRSKPASGKKYVGGAGSCAKSPSCPTAERTTGRVVGDSSPQKGRKKHSSRSQSMSKTGGIVGGGGSSLSSIDRRGPEGGNHRIHKARGELSRPALINSTLNGAACAALKKPRQGKRI